MPIAEMAYRSGLRALRLASPLLGRGGSKLARGVRGRRAAVERLTGWARAHRDLLRPLVWFHAPSVGEGLQARAVLQALRSLSAHPQLAFTHFSPSAEPLARRMEVDVADYLPWDVRSEIAAALDSLRPSLVVFTKTEVWPVLAGEASNHGVPLALVAGTLPLGSSRLSRPARALLTPAFARLSTVHAVAAEDGARFGLLGVRRERVVVTGDPGVDSAARRVRSADLSAPYLQPFKRARPRIVAGSTWPADERVLLPACAALRSRVAGLELVLAPHEPDETHVAGLMERLRREGWRVVTLSEVERTGSLGVHDAVVVDRVGVLAELYRVGTAAYVGGGFHARGLHSVLEPAAAGLPVCFGPRHWNARAAGDLVGVGAARVAVGLESLSGVLEGWLSDERARGSAGRAASAYVDAHLGAAERSARLLLELIERRGPLVSRD